ncbi:hypothetical protein GRI38_03485 [Altererythrobacter aurantiacus]|uniref:Uncharacterized protein n=1 Tax=Parapontixanthobacter aurantiacus TaxID=1463599 RepID=A0A844ZBB0_9SPHN|nr:hypothetical protein [Parapontixanthobacter aurantiacus]MXO85088.1 hypothetical protein [Parapontixanthobacter aurantiacus]
MDAKGITFLICWTAFAAIAAWVCFNRLNAAKETGTFRYLFHGIGEENWSNLFGLLKGFLNVQAYIFCLMAGIGLVWLAATLIGKVK